MGFSAGGHLAATAGTHFDLGETDATDPVQRVSCRPDFLVLVYPVITMGVKGHSGSRNQSPGQESGCQTGGLVLQREAGYRENAAGLSRHAKDDRPVPPENSRMFYDALRHKVAAIISNCPPAGTASTATRAHVGRLAGTVAGLAEGNEIRASDEIALAASDGIFLG